MILPDSYHQATMQNRSSLPPLRLRNLAMPLSLLRAPERLAPQTSAQRQQDLWLGDLLLTAEGLKPIREAGKDTPSLDLAGRILLPRFAEAHCHLDKCHSIGRLEGVGGDLMTAIALQRGDKKNWTDEDLFYRCNKGLEELYEGGCKEVRSHVDWDSDALAPGEAPRAWEILGDLAETWRGRIDLQRAALLGIELVREGAKAEATAQRIASDGGVLGGFVFGQEGLYEDLRALFILAQRHGLMLDFHVDEGLAPDLNGIAAIAEMAIDLKFDRPILCGHVCSLVNLEGQALQDRLGLMREATLHIVSLPGTNLYLQGREQGTPRRRGLTRVREMIEAGLSVSIGSDNVADAFYPLGGHAPLANLGLATLAAHLDPPMGRWLPLITHNPRRALGQEPAWLEDIKPPDLLLCEAEQTAALLSARPPMALEDKIRFMMKK